MSVHATNCNSEGNLTYTSSETRSRLDQNGKRKGKRSHGSSEDKNGPRERESRLSSRLSLSIAGRLARSSERVNAANERIADDRERNQDTNYKVCGIANKLGDASAGAIVNTEDIGAEVEESEEQGDLGQVLRDVRRGIEVALGLEDGSLMRKMRMLDFLVCDKYDCRGRCISKDESVNG